jgi:hypothetical protein
MLRELRQDVRYAARVYRRRTLVTGLALSALALAIGATTGVFSVLNAVLFRGLPFRDAARVVEVEEVQVDEDNGRAAFYGWRNGNAYLEDAAAYAAAAGNTEMNLSVEAGSRRALSAPSGKPDQGMALGRMCTATWISSRDRGPHSPPRCTATPRDTWLRARTRCRRPIRRSRCTTSKRSISA